MASSEEEPGEFVFEGRTPESTKMSQVWHKTKIALGKKAGDRRAILLSLTKTVFKEPHTNLNNTWHMVNAKLILYHHHSIKDIRISCS